jgi:hypothetical protein
MTETIAGKLPRIPKGGGNQTAAKKKILRKTSQQFVK